MSLYRKYKSASVISISLFLIFCMPFSIWAKDYIITKEKSYIDGRIFCEGKACTSSDRIIISSGLRGALLLKNFDGKGSYISICNENSPANLPVTIENDGGPGTGVLTLESCAYVDLRGNGDPDMVYGIKISHDTDPGDRSGSLKTRGDCDYIKIGYIEIEHVGSGSATGNSGIHIKSDELKSNIVLSNFEIHHNYIHNVRYAGMYLGSNEPDKEDSPYLSGWSIHDNILENMGAYGITFKGVTGIAENTIYNNTVKKTGLIHDDLSDNFKHGIGFHFFYNKSAVSVFGNRIEDTVGPGLKIGGGPGSKVYQNEILGCGKGGDVDSGHGIEILRSEANNIEFYENIIIQANGYGIYGHYNANNNLHRNNIIAGCRIGEAGGQGLIEGTDAFANNYKESVEAMKFKAWSDDGDYSNDIFQINNISRPSNLQIVGIP